MKKNFEKIFHSGGMFTDFQNKEIDIIEISGLTHDQGNRQLIFEVKSPGGGGRMGGVWQRHARLTVYVPTCNRVGVRGGLEGLEVEATKAPPPTATTEVSKPAEQIPAAKPASVSEDKILHSPKQRQVESERTRSRGRTEPTPQVERSAEAARAPSPQPRNNQVGDTAVPTPKPAGSEVKEPARSPRQAAVEPQRPARETPPGKKQGAGNKKKTDEKKGAEQETPPQPPPAPSRPPP
jgi:hypothetical protein